MDLTIEIPDNVSIITNNTYVCPSPPKSKYLEYSKNLIKEFYDTGNCFDWDFQYFFVDL